jgi:hypothetical protein
MHFEILVEDASGELLGALLPKILGVPHTWRTHAYKGIGRVPKDLRGKTDPWRRILLDQLPRILAGYGKSLQSTNSAVVVIVDLDRRDCIEFKQELLRVLKRCRPRPTVLDSYVQDSICGTWEKLAGAVFPGGSTPLKAGGYPRIGEEKCRWASLIGPHLDVESNLSPSFRVLKDGLLKLCGAGVGGGPPRPAVKARKTI